MTVDRDVVVDDPAISVIRINGVPGDRCGLHVHAVAMIDVVQVAPERAVLHATGHTEVGLGARRCAGNPAAAGDEVTAFGGRCAARDAGRRGAEDQVRAGARRHVQGVDHDVGAADDLRANGDDALRGDLLVNDYEAAPGQEDHLVGLSAHGDGLAVNGQPLDLDLSADRRPVCRTGRRCSRHDEVGHDDIAGGGKAATADTDVGNGCFRGRHVSLTNNGGVGHSPREHASHALPQRRGFLSAARHGQRAAIHEGQVAPQCEP